MRTKLKKISFITFISFLVSVSFFSWNKKSRQADLTEEKLDSVLLESQELQVNSGSMQVKSDCDDSALFVGCNGFF